MAGISRILSRPTAKPYRNKNIAHSLANPPALNDDGHLTFDDDDIENPQNWSFARRTYITICAVLLVVNATFASASPSGCLESIQSYFGVSTEAAGLTITLFLLGYCAGPLIFAPLSEFYGRRPLFYVTFIAYLAFNFLCAFPPNFGALLVGRFLTGTFVSAPLSNAPGVLADLWPPLARGVAMAGFSLMVWAGPALGPVISGFLQLTKGDEGWRWSFYVLLMLGGATACTLFTIPETYGPVILCRKAKRVRAARLPGFEDVKAPMEATDRSLASVYKVALTRPWIILFDPISFLCAVYMSVVYLLLYMLFAIYPIVFEQHRGWNAGVGELPLIGLIIGAALGSLIILWDTKYQSRKAEQQGGGGDAMRPEDRLRTALFGGPTLAAAMFWFAWSANYDYVHWVVPTLAGVFLAASMLCIFVSFLNYLVDVYLMYAASAIAANTVMRSAAGAAAPLFTRQMFTALGIGGGGSLIGGVGAVLALIPIAFYRYGEPIRRRSRFSPTAGPATEEKSGGGDHDVEKGHAGKGRRSSGEEEEEQKGQGEDESGIGGGAVASSLGERSDDTGTDEKMEVRRERGRVHRGDRESLDSNPFDYAVDEPTPARHKR